MIVRGLLAVTNCECELQMSQTKRISAPEVDTVFFTTSLQYGYLSTSNVKEIAKFGGDISQFVPEYVVHKVEEKFRQDSVR